MDGVEMVGSNYECMHGKIGQKIKNNITNDISILFFTSCSSIGINVGIVYTFFFTVFFTNTDSNNCFIRLTVEVYA